MLMDINGDGLVDMLRKAENQTASDFTEYEVYYNTGAKISSSSFETIYIPIWTEKVLGKYTIDNRAINSNNISYGDDSVNLQNVVEIDLSSVSDKINNLDCSVTVSNNISGNLSVNVTIPIPVAWTGFSFNATVNVGGGLNSGSTNTSATVKMMDLDGDGLADHVLRIPGQGTYWKQNISGTYGQLERVNLPQGGNIEIEYEPKYGTTDNPNFKYVMSKVTVNDGVDGKGNLPEVKHGEHSVVTSYKYDNGYYDRELKEFLGFGTVTTISSDTVQTDEYYNREYYSKGCIKTSTVKDLSKNILSVQETVLNEAPYALVKSETVKNYENRKYLTVNTEYEYDNFGNCTKLTQNFGDGKKLVADISYAEITDKYIMGLPYDIKVTGTEGTLRHRWGKYDENGQLEELHQYYNQSAYSVNTFKYDNYGNIIKVSDSRGATLEYKYDETHNMFLEEIKQYGTDTDIYKSEIKYDYALQLKKSETDCNGNSLTYKYDSWKRIEKIFTSYDKDGVPAVSYEYHTPDNSIKESAGLWYAITNNKVAFKTDDQNNSIPVIQTVLQIDGLGRAVRTAKTGFVNGVEGWNISGVVEYDEKGRTIKEGMPEFVSGSLEDLLLTTPEMTDLKTSYEYDVKDRQIKTILPDGSEQSVFYYVEGNRAIARSTDPNGNVSIQESDSRGNIVRVAREDKNGKQLTEVTYEYNEMGEMCKAYDAQKNAITVEYDMLGRRTALESKDSGRQEFFYDECSNLVRENNSVLREQNKQINYTYDNLNRLIYIDYPGTEEDTVYVYGKTSDSNINAAGKILSVKDASGTISYEYGQLGEVVKETRVLNTHLNGKNATELAVMQYQSDYLGRMQWIIYPDGEKIIYGYDEGGQVTSVEGSHYNQTFPYVTKILYDQYGQRTRIEYGNGTATDYTYNPERRWLETVKTRNKYGQSYQNIRYDFDCVGNVRSYVNDCMDTLSGNYKTDQSYEYDDLYQLIHVTGNTEYYPAISSVPDYKSTYTQDFAFDDKGLGNMMSKVSKETVSPLKVIGDNLNYNIGYVYDENYAHRLVQAGNRYYKYDANGNIICEQDGSFDGSENDESYYKVEQHSEDVYSTDNGWGLFKDESSEARGQARKYRRTYTWNSRNQLVSSVDSNYSTSYVYGQDGQRSNKYTQGSETLYFNKMWTLHTDNGNSVYGGQYAKNVYLGETRIVTKLARADQKTAHEEMYKQYYYHSDHLGSATMITDWEGKEYQRIEYTPYGETWVEKTNNSGSEFLPYKFTGKEVDQETGLYYYGARYLDPKYSMWISTDPALGEYIPEMGKGNAKDSGSLPGMGGVFNHINGNLYAYAANNPIKYTDPDGRIPFLVVTAAVGALVGAAYGAYKSYSETGSVNWTEVGKDALIGGAIGLGAGALTSVAVTGLATSSVTTVTSGISAGLSAATGGTSIYSLDKFARGWEAEQRLGGMMNNFPTIDKFGKVVNGIAKSISSIKSMDLGCKTYQSVSNITRTINGYVTKLANFTSGRLGSLVVNADESTKRLLDLAIPRGASREQMKAIQECVKSAAKQGVELVIHIID